MKSKPKKNKDEFGKAWEILCYCQMQEKSSRANFQRYFEFFVVPRKLYLSIPRLFYELLLIFFKTLGFRENLVGNTALRC